VAKKVATNTRIKEKIIRALVATKNFSCISGKKIATKKPGKAKIVL